MRVTLASIDRVIKEALNKYGVSEETIKILTGAIHYANQSGITTHGIRHLPMYINKIVSGHLNPRDDTERIVDFEAVTVLDAKGTFGQVAAQHALEIGMEKAKKYGISLVGVRNSNTFGAAGYYGHQAAVQGMAAIIFANAAPAIAPTGGNKAIFGTNPLCYAFPGGPNHNPIVLDMATTVAARSKIKMAAKNGEKIPFDWAVGPDGEPTDDPNVALLGTLLPIAGYKGYGLSLFIDVFSGLMTGSAFAGEVRPLTDTNNNSQNGQCYIFVNVEKMMAPDEMNARIDLLYQRVKSCGEAGNVLLPGEIGYMKEKEQTISVVISEKEFDEVNQMANKLGIDARLEEEDNK